MTSRNGARALLSAILFAMLLGAAPTNAGATTYGFNVFFMGPWSSTTTYSAGNAVTYTDGATYISLVNKNTGIPPNTNPGDWAIMDAPGAMGATGRAGPQGPAGATGATGATGAQGPQGPMGPPGPMGPTGAAGAQGLAGAQGPAGPAGAQGPAGPIGATGAQGPPGMNGTNGAGVPTCTAPSTFLVLQNGALACQVRYVDNGDGTVTDNMTGLMWEKKSPAGTGDVHDVLNTWTWTVTG